MNTHLIDWSSELSDSDHAVDLLVNEYDTTSMPLPDIEFEPHLLISKVRKHYMEYIIKLLSINYENNQKLLNKNIYLPSAIWRCAKNIEMKAAQTCMVVQLYRKNIVAAITELKNDTKRGKLNKKLYECLRKPSVNEKKLQTTLSNTIDCHCQCVCNKRKKFRKTTISPKTIPNEISNMSTNVKNDVSIYNIPVIANLQADSPQVADINYTTASKKSPLSINVNQTKFSDLSHNPPRMSIESQDSDELMMQLEKLFQCDSQEDELFEGPLYDNLETSLQDDLTKKKECNETQLNQPHESVISNHTAQIKSLDERLASLTGLLVNNFDNNVQHEKVENPKSNHKPSTSKWLCEEYFLKAKLFELLDQIGDCNRKKLARIKEMLTELFGEDSDEECIMSPLEETPEFVISCKERIAPWVVKLLTPYYIKGRIRGKSLFKALAKHLIRLIYQCSRYPQEYEVNSFVSDFLQNHKMIRCEADFKQFRIENL
ncbi:unnamed protein product [Diatraea saccharalis]|uniref:Set2 Rpb1 interacting domain-containing protein n=1 Tax=Diatraea saccharalis TaxID=40085 RepID=A0A9N9RA62_9NEOP|nr:unnamed protein product [Diatraea saccharalis]